MIKTMQTQTIIRLLYPLSEVEEFTGDKYTIKYDHFMRRYEVYGVNGVDIDFVQEDCLDDTYDKIFNCLPDIKVVQGMRGNEMYGFIERGDQIFFEYTMVTTGKEKEFNTLGRKSECLKK